MDLRLFFPLWSMTSIIGEVSSAGKQELNKLKKFGTNYILPYIHAKHYTKFPFKINIVFFIYSDIEITSLLILSSYIMNLLGCYSLQSDDYRVVPEFNMTTKKVVSKEAEGCRITIEPLRVK